MRRLSFGAMLLAMLVAFGLSSGTANADTVTLDIPLVGAQENPPVVSPGSGSARVTFNDQTNVLTVDVTVSGLSAGLVTAAHIHRGAVGVNGPVVHLLSGTGFTQVSRTINLSAADVNDLRAGHFYINVHSTEHPTGFARGQIVLPGTPDDEPDAGLADDSRPISPPATGDAGLADNAGAWGAVAGLAVLLSAGLLVPAVAPRRR